MQHVTIPDVDRPMSRLVQGTVMLDLNDPAPGFAVLDAVIAHGANAFDTARHYGRGSEAAFGRWVKERGNRDEIVLIGKGAHHSPERKRVTPEDITDDLETSLQEFGFDTIDLYLLHRDDPAVPVGPIVETLDHHRRAGKIRAYGGSNWSHQRIAEANAYAAEHGHAPFVASSPNLSLAVWTQPPWDDCISLSGPDAAEARAWYTEHPLAIVPWSSLAGGFFTGRYRPDNLDQFTEYFDVTTIKAYATDANFQRLERAEALAATRGFTLPQVALAYVLNQPMNMCGLIGPRTPAELAENVKALDITLTQEELDWLDLTNDATPSDVAT